MWQLADTYSKGILHLPKLMNSPPFQGCAADMPLCFAQFNQRTSLLPIL
jgi:hypothetical protein